MKISILESCVKLNDIYCKISALKYDNIYALHKVNYIILLQTINTNYVRFNLRYIYLFQDMFNGILCYIFKQRGQL